MSENSINGKSVSDAQIQEWADEAERGYDVAELKGLGNSRTGGAVAPSQPPCLGPVDPGK